MPNAIIGKRIYTQSTCDVDKLTMAIRSNNQFCHDNTSTSHHMSQQHTRINNPGDRSTWINIWRWQINNGYIIEQPIVSWKYKHISSHVTWTHIHQQSRRQINMHPGTLHTINHSLRYPPSMLKCIINVSITTHAAGSWHTGHAIMFSPHSVS